MNCKKDSKVENRHQNSVKFFTIVLCFVILGKCLPSKVVWVRGIVLCSQPYKVKPAITFCVFLAVCNASLPSAQRSAVLLHKSSQATVLHQFLYLRPAPQSSSAWRLNQIRHLRVAGIETSVKHGGQSYHLSITWIIQRVSYKYLPD